MSYTPMSDLGQQGLFDITRTLLQQPDLASLCVLTPKSWTVKHEAYRSDSDIQLESDLLISG